MERRTLDPVMLPNATAPAEMPRPMTPGARSRISRLAGRWDWRLSAHCRLGSAAALWAIVFASPFIGFLVGPLLLIRFVTSAVQMGLNHRLQNRQPIVRAPLGDWMLLGLAIVGASVAAAIEPGNSVPTNPLLISLALAPFTAVQVRIAMRSYATANDRAEPTPLPARPATAEAAA
jgi:hypothetical protein